VPEGDTVWLAARRMHLALAGQAITTSDFRVPQLATTDLRGREVLEVVSRGKHMLTRVQGDLTLHTHFRMDGSWRLYSAKQQIPRDDPRIRVLLGNPAWLAAGYQLPVVELLPTDRENDAVGHLGPDLLGDEWDPERAANNLRAEPTAEIGMALLDQRYLAGLGNMYRCEICFLRGLHPWTPIADIPALEPVVALSRRVLMANRNRPEQSTTGQLRRDQALYVYGRAGRPCRRCGSTIQQAEQGRAPYARVTYWCPRCQPR
jgi:endonuclease-8